MSEEWVIVPKYEDYAVSTLGKVKRITDSKTYKSGKILKQNINYAGYADVTLRSNGKPRNFRVNRLVLTAFRGIPADGYEASHIDGDRRNNTLNNLVWETQEENNKRRIYHGTSKGERNAKSKLTENIVREIRAQYEKRKTTYAELGKKYGVSFAQIGHIIKRRQWSHV